MERLNHYLLKRFILEKKTFSRNQYEIEIRRGSPGYGDFYYLIDEKGAKEIDAEYAMILITNDTVFWCSDMESID